MGPLHTHNRRLDLHPHVHMVMPAAALDADKKIWRTKVRRRSRRGRANGSAKPGHTDSPGGEAVGGGDSGGGYLFNHKALAKVFKAKLLDAIKAAGLTLPAALPDTWVVDAPLRRRRPEGLAVPEPIPLSRRHPGARHPALRR